MPPKTVRWTFYLQLLTGALGVLLLAFSSYGLTVLPEQGKKFLVLYGEGTDNHIQSAREIMNWTLREAVLTIVASLALAWFVRAGRRWARIATFLAAAPVLFITLMATADHRTSALVENEQMLYPAGYIATYRITSLLTIAGYLAICVLLFLDQSKQHFFNRSTPLDDRWDLNKVTRT